MALGPDLVTGRSRYRSVTVHGGRAAAEAARARWAAKAELVRSIGRSRPGITIRRLLQEWLAADHGWRPSTQSGYQSVVKFVTHDRIAARRAVDLTPKVMTAVSAAWRAQGWPEPTVSGRIRVLRSALGWAHMEGILDVFPLDGMHGPPHAGVRMHVPVDQVCALLEHARRDVAELKPDTKASLSALHRAEQVLLLARLAADSGARRGELAALQIADLDGDVLTIARAASMEIVGPTKTRRVRRLTLGAGAAELWRESVHGWQQRTGDDAAETPSREDPGDAQIRRVGPWRWSDARPPRRQAPDFPGCGPAVRPGHQDGPLHRSSAGHRPPPPSGGRSTGSSPCWS